MTKCQRCVEKKAHNPRIVVQNADYVLVEYDGLLFLCGDCIDEVCHMMGEMNLDFYHVQLGLEGLLRRLHEILVFQSKRYSELLKKVKTVD